MGSRWTDGCAVDVTLDEQEQDCGFDITTVNALGYHKSEDSPLFADLATLETRAAWEALILAGTVLITPRLAYNTVITQSEPITQGTPGGTDTENASEEIIGDTPPAGSFSIAKPNRNVTNELKKLNILGQTGVNFIYLDIRKNKIYIAINDDDGSYSGFPAIRSTVYVSSRSVDNQNKNFATLSYKKEPDWDCYLVNITPVDFKVADLIPGA